MRRLPAKRDVGAASSRRRRKAPPPPQRPAAADRDDEWPDSAGVDRSGAGAVGRLAPASARLPAWCSRIPRATAFHIELPAFGPLVLRLDGGADVKKFIAAELAL